MTESLAGHTLLILLVGMTLIAALIGKAGLERLSLPAIVGYIAVGLLLSAMDATFGILSSDVRHGFRFLAESGVVALLFRIGLESNIVALKEQLQRASLIWVGNVAISAGLGFLATYAVLGYGLIPSLFVATALSATSIGVSTTMWREAGVLSSADGALLLDVAELDDISGVVLMALLFALVPILRLGGGDLVSAVTGAGGWLLVKFASFCALCYVFAHYIEQRLTRWYTARSAEPSPMLLVAGIGFVIAALADWLGFSLAIGAIFAGLAFSRDPAEARIDRAFAPLYQFFSPFFFVGIGLSVAIDSLETALGVGGILLVVAALGKFLGGALPALALTGASGAALIGVSLIPRAEIAMVIMQRGRQLGDWAVPAELFGGMVMVTLGTCLLAPVAVTAMLRRRAPTRSSDRVGNPRLPRK